MAPGSEASRSLKSTDVAHKSTPPIPEEEPKDEGAFTSSATPANKSEQGELLSSCTQFQVTDGGLQPDHLLRLAFEAGNEVPDSLRPSNVALTSMPRPSIAPSPQESLPHTTPAPSESPISAPKAVNVLPAKDNTHSLSAPSTPRPSILPRPVPRRTTTAQSLEALPRAITSPPLPSHKTSTAPLPKPYVPNFGPTTYTIPQYATVSQHSPPMDQVLSGSEQPVRLESSPVDACSKKTKDHRKENSLIEDMYLSVDMEMELSGENTISKEDCGHAELAQNISDHPLRVSLEGVDADVMHQS
ncbi:hypothetical protein SERLADRAFT_438207 [Serpula lacrymans var. lacrymans S7.9]|uniref:Uncharacterized protein n=1 Tax=Serpula lacrymans var. lacrymans (strain S7.9) TaxID=578457 RepID=F8NXC0_SERL9|nr:uncharacterized protein SERLADRAFT_438207 [Serpula lacrymans var. lacrymans S7.9]EGO24592.1 hypothetical protein SERLADRAFT_438207 [Serpula lacrymans var. lacrymans S7.9]